jgi:abscisic acid receptor PYR/PYL family
LKVTGFCADSLTDLLVIFFQNYSSILTVHPEVIDGRPGTLVIESFVVDVPEGNTKDETCYFVEALLKCNLKSLEEVSERLVIKDQTEPLDR